MLASRLRAIGGHVRAAVCALAFIASLALGSIVLHTIKLVLGRRRPRDEMEMGLYGFMPLAFNPTTIRFPSGHALTIMCVAVIACAVWPMLWPLWFGVALWLGLTRALLTAHYPQRRTGRRGHRVDFSARGGHSYLAAHTFLVLKRCSRS